MSEDLEQEQQTDADLRAAAFADEDAGREVVVHNGKRYAVRAPTVEEQRSATLASQRPVKQDGKPLKVNGRQVYEVDAWEQGVRLLIACTSNPDTGKALFSREDLPALMKRSSGKGSLLAVLTRALKDVMTVEDEAVENEAGNSEGDQTATPSSP